MQTEPNGDNLITHVQLTERDDFDTVELPELFLAAVNNQHYEVPLIPGLREIATDYYPWIPEHIFEEVTTNIETYVKNAADLDVTDYEIAQLFCKNLATTYDSWVAEEDTRVQTMYASEADLEELYELAARASTTERDIFQERVRTQFNRANKEFIPTERLIRLLDYTETNYEELVPAV